MNKELDRIKKLAGVEPKAEVTEKIELTASNDRDEKDVKASDVSQAMQMAKIKQKMENRDTDDVDFNGLFTGVARGEIRLDDKGKIAEATFGIIKGLEEACGKKHKKEVKEANFNTQGAFTAKIFGKEGEGDEVLDSDHTDKKKEEKEAKKKTDESANAEKKAGRRAAGSYGRPGSKDQKRAASKSSRKKGKEETKDKDIDCEGETFPKDSLSRIMVEMILDEMKTGKNVREISEELSFDFDGVQFIYDHLKKKSLT